MTITPIATILTWPNGTPVEATSGTIVSVYEYNTINTKYGPKTKQNAMLKDASGNQIRIEAWEHPDMTPLKDKALVLQNKGKGGVMVKHDSYKDKTTILLSVGKAGVFQHVEVFQSANPDASKAPSASNPEPLNAGQSQVTHKPSDGLKTQATAVNGAKVGMALNNAVLLLTHGDKIGHAAHEEILKELSYTASEIIELSNWLESGHLAHRPKSPEVAPESTGDQPF